ncbi:polyketide synthase, partial [Paenibacillus spiritus]
MVGIACRFPGAPDPDAFWSLLRQGLDAVGEVPADRFDLDRFFDPDAAVPGKTSSRWGGFLGAVDAFDPGFFGLSAREADSMDPQQRLLLELAAEALDDAGLPAASLAGSDTGVFVGISASDYSRRLFADPDRIDIYSGTGGALSIAANRLSYLLDLRGPSLAVDTACSSSLVAVHLACRALAAGEASAALVGGVNLILAPDLSINFAKMGAMAPDGRCKSFDARADGYVRGEGAGLLVLKTLEQARADGDRIYAVIRGSAVNQDGRSNGLTAPSRQAQEAVLRSAYSRAGVSPGDLRYVETHGTGTPLGDPIEAAALGAVLAEGRPEGQLCAIGSVKTNIGHLEAAAGVAGLIKTALALWHRELPASLHFGEANPRIPFDRLPLKVQTAPSAWPVGEPGEAPLAGVSSFGFGGTNAHVVLQAAWKEADEMNVQGSEASEAAELLPLPLSAHSPAALADMARRYADYLDTAPASIGAIGYNAARRRDHRPFRLFVAGRSASEWAAALREALDERAAGALHPDA